MVKGDIKATKVSDNSITLGKQPAGVAKRYGAPVKAALDKAAAKGSKLNKTALMALLTTRGSKLTPEKAAKIVLQVFKNAKPTIKINTSAIFKNKTNQMSVNEIIGNNSKVQQKEYDQKLMMGKYVDSLSRNEQRRMLQVLHDGFNGDKLDMAGLSKNINETATILKGLYKNSGLDPLQYQGAVQVDLFKALGGRFEGKKAVMPGKLVTSSSESPFKNVNMTSYKTDPFKAFAERMASLATKTAVKKNRND